MTAEPEVVILGEGPSPDDPLYVDVMIGTLDHGQMTVRVHHSIVASEDRGPLMAVLRQARARQADPLSTEHKPARR